MIIYYTKDFKDVLKDPARYINISKFKLSSCKDIESYKLNLMPQQKEVITSPTAGYYNAEGIVSGNLLSLSIRIPISDISIEDYTTLFVFYDDLSNVSDDLFPKLAFIISGGMVLKELDEGDMRIFFEKLNLEPEGTIITIPDFKHECSLKLNQSNDVDFLEGKGVGNVYSLFLDNDEIRNFGYVSRESYEAYLLEQRGDDDYDHLYTQYINNYGLKIY